jgi:tRNA(Ile)-lysidine synthase
MRLERAKRVLEVVERSGMLRAGERVGVGVSGGADSVGLLRVLCELQEKLGIVVSVVHFNHELRGKASDADEKFVEKLAARLGVEFIAGRENIREKAKREKANLEDAARRARYAFFARLVNEGKVDCVAIAHTMDDQAETVLGHILRGTGLAGLGGIHPETGVVIRPLLGVRREELRAYLKLREQSWREDATNRDMTRLRARVRKKLLPLLEKQFQPRVVEHLANLAELAREDESLLEKLAGEWIKKAIEKNGEESRIAIDKFFWCGGEKRDTADSKDLNGGDNKKSVSRAFAKRVVRKIVEELKAHAGELGAQHVEAVLRLADEGQNGKGLELPGGVEARRERDALIFSARRSTEKRASPLPARQYEYDLKLEKTDTTVRVVELECEFRLRVIDWPAKRGETKGVGAVLDRDRLQLPLVLRNWKPGDRLHAAGHRGAHKLKRLLNEKHVSRWERDGWPVLTSEGTIVWARGFPVAAKYAVDERTKTGIVIVEEPY